MLRAIRCKPSAKVTAQPCSVRKLLWICKIGMDAEVTGTSIQNSAVTCPVHTKSMRILGMRARDSPVKPKDSRQAAETQRMICTVTAGVTECDTALHMHARNSAVFECARKKLVLDHLAIERHARPAKSLCGGALVALGPGECRNQRLLLRIL